MARPASLLFIFSHPRLPDSSRRGFFFFLPTSLALLTSLFILFYISSTSKLFTHDPYRPIIVPLLQPPIGSLVISPLVANISQIFLQVPSSSVFPSPGPVEPTLSPNVGKDGGEEIRPRSKGNAVNNEVFHDKDIFLENYKEMNRSFKIYVYPHRKDDDFANALLPVDFEPGGNYASEGYFKKVLMKSHFITEDPSKAHLFFLPFSIARLRHDERVGVGGIQDFVRDYVFNISRKYPYWNLTGGADHFYVACHSIGRSAMEKAEMVKFNVIQAVCSSSYFLSGYITHKDVSVPQIWPRQGDPPNLISTKRKRLAFFAGSINSPVRQRLIEAWQNDSDIFAHVGRLTTPYADELLGSKFCLHVKGFEVNTARIADSIYYGCIPVIIANHYDLPFADVLNWKSFSIVVPTLDIPLLKEILQKVSHGEYLKLQKNVLRVRKHFKWNVLSTDYDAFYMVMYELWLRRSSVSVLVNAPRVRSRGVKTDRKYGPVIFSVVINLMDAGSVIVNDQTGGSSEVLKLLNWKCQVL